MVGESPLSAAVAIDVIVGAARERWHAAIAPQPSRGRLQVQAIGLALIGSAAACLIGLLANIAAVALFSHFGSRPDFHSVVTDGLPRITYPPRVLRVLPSLLWLSDLGLARAFLALAARGLRWRWRFTVSAIELGLWSAGFFLSTTLLQFRELIGNGQPGFPIYSRYAMWESATLSIAAAAIWLASITSVGMSIRDGLRDLRKRRSLGDSPGLGA
jgi:hypothetical protein